jgi:tRNA (cytidine/uridine-2'-O-)-methyltransferase
MKSLQTEEDAQVKTPMLHIALLEPEIPPNTGNIMRLCAATSTRLHLIGRLGFHLDDRNLRRAGLDYLDAVDLLLHATLEDFERTIAPARIFCFSARADAPYTSITYQDGDCLLFGCESQGLPASVLERYAGSVLQIPMPAARVRSLNLSTAVGVALYEVLRQLHRW